MNYNYIILAILVGIVFSIIFFLFYRKKYKIEQKIVDDKYYSEIDALKEQINNIQLQKDNKLKELNILVQQKELSQRDIDNLQQQFNSLNLNLQAMEKTAQQTADDLLKEKLKLVEQNFDKRLEELGENYQEQKDKYIKDYTLMLEDYSQSFYNINQEKINGLNNELSDLESKRKEKEEELGALITRVNTAVEASKRAELEKNEKVFYRLQLTDNELADVKFLKEVEPHLINKEVLAKLIWKTYYERPYTEMCNRVLGQGIKMGIYKITNLENNMAYVGQSVNIRERWREHIKAGLGINSSNNRLYTSMKQFGPENFMFELLEECERPLLNQKEKYWIDFFHTEDFGLNSNKGVSK